MLSNVVWNAKTLIGIKITGLMKLNCSSTKMTYIMLSLLKQLNKLYNCQS